MSSNIDALIMRCEAEKREMQLGERSTFSPLVNGLLGKSFENGLANQEEGSVLDVLRQRQQFYKDNSSFGALKEATEGFVISVADVAKRTYTSAFKRIAGIVKNMNPSREEDGEIQH